jgi:hypothetical protein
LEEKSLLSATIRRKLAALASLFEHLRETNSVSHDSAKGVKRLGVEFQQGKTNQLHSHFLEDSASERLTASLSIYFDSNTVLANQCEKDSRVL